MDILASYVGSVCSFVYQKPDSPPKERTVYLDRLTDNGFYRGYDFTNAGWRNFYPEHVTEVSTSIPNSAYKVHRSSLPSTITQEDLLKGYRKDGTPACMADGGVIVYKGVSQCI